MDPTLALPTAWCPQRTWTHRRVRLPWLPRWLRHRLPARLAYRTCTTAAPASLCRCGMYQLLWERQHYAC